MDIQANSNWLYIVPWGMYGCVNYLKQKYGNPTVYITENGIKSYVLLLNISHECVAYQG
jgi:beta-glucosidase/6-phospho-beta-glucosidase/beta-galactosidase